MALDTRNQRGSAINPGAPWRGVLPAPDGTLDLGDREQVAGVYRFPTEGSAPPDLLLENAAVSFVFHADPTTGLKLRSFAAVGSNVWMNEDTEMWRATVFDTFAGSPFPTTAITPTAAQFGGFNLQRDATGQFFTAVWTAIPLGFGDFLSVALAFRLNDDEDWLRVRVIAAFVGTPTRFAFDAITPLPLLMDPNHQGSDYAVIPFGMGILSKDPIVNLRYDPTGGRPSTGFGQLTTNKWTYPVGRGWTMALWGYYETVSSSAWMLWLEDWSLEALFITWESDGTRLKLEMEQPQPDHVLVGNASAKLGSAYTFCLRPFRLAQPSGWCDMGRHYRKRLETLKPVFHTALRPERPDLSPTERAYSIYLDMLFDDTHVPGDGKPGNIAAAVASVRAHSGAAEGTHVWGTVEAASYRLAYVGEAPNGDLADKLRSLQAAGDVHLHAWMPSLIGPQVWAIERWHRSPGDQAELRWWTTNAGVGALRNTRDGRLNGGGLDRLAYDTLRTGYYRERIYSVASWSAGSNVLTVSGGAPATDGFTGVLSVVLVPPSGATRLAIALVQTLGATTVTTTGPFLDALGNVITPTNADTVVVVTHELAIGIPGVHGLFCPHAIVNADAYFDRLKTNMAAGMWENWKGAGQYLDVFSEPLLQHQDQNGRSRFCYRDHTSWSKINSGSARHPYGGGDWFKKARRQFVGEIRQSIRDAQLSSGAIPFAPVSVEDVDETMLDVIDLSWHPISAGGLWRNTIGFDPAIHGYKTIPLFAVVYAGRIMCRAVGTEFSSGLLDPNYPSNDPELIQFLGYTLASEWPYGITTPVISLYETNTSPLRDLWDDSHYVENGGLIDNRVRQMRDLWTQIVTAESRWVLRWLRFGEFMPPAVVDLAATSTTVSKSGSFYTTVPGSLFGFYWSYDTIYDRNLFPRVTHAIWRAPDQSICVVFVNWTDTQARWTGTLPTTLLGLGAPGSPELAAQVARRLNAAGDEFSSFGFDPSTGKLTLDVVPAYSVAFVTFQPVGVTAEVLAPPGIYELELELGRSGEGVDLVLERGDLKLDRGLRTPSVVSLFSDARNPVEAHADDPDPRGWWPDSDGDRFGSLLWLIEHRKSTPKTLDDARQWAKDGLAWMVARGIAKSIDVAAEPVGRHGGVITVTVNRAPGLSFDSLWENEQLADLDLAGFRFRLLSR